MRHDLPGQTDMPIPGAQASDQIQRAIQAPLRPDKPQQPCDIGLFSDDADQMDLIEMCMNPHE